MKRTLLTLLLAAFSIHFSWSQCVTTCTNYVVMPVTFTTIPTTGHTVVTSFSPNSDDGYSSPVQIGFPFDFYCTSYTSLLIYTNGLLQFNIGAPSTFPLGYDPAQYIPNPSLPTVLNGIVAFKMDDLDPGVGGTISYATMGTAPNRMFVLTYSNVPVFGNSGLLNSGQIVLYETTNNIEIYTIAAPLSPNYATQGIENALGTLATASPGRNQSNWSGNNDAFRFIPVTPAVPSAIMGSTLICQGVQSTYSIATQPGAVSYTWSVPAGWSGSSTTTSVPATTGASGNVSVAATYSCGTSAPTTLSVTVTPAPVVSIVSTDPPVVCSGANFTITPAGGLTYTLNPGGITTTGVFILSAQSNTLYTLTGSDANCNSFNTSTTSIIINPSPTISVNSGSVCEGQQFTITPTGVGADSYNVTGGFLSVTPPVGTYTYQVIGNNSANGCSSAPVVSNLTVNAVPSVTVASVRSIICKGENEKLTASGAATYSWSNGLTTNTIIVSPTANAQYTVTGTTAQGCSRAKTISLVVAPCTGIESFSSQNGGVSVFPNPSNGSFNLRLTDVSSATTVQVFDATGRLILTRTTTAADNHFDLSEQANGFYYIKVQNTGVQETIKLVKN